MNARLFFDKIILEKSKLGEDILFSDILVKINNPTKVPDILKSCDRVNISTYKYKITPMRLGLWVNEVSALSRNLYDEGFYKVIVSINSTDIAKSLPDYCDELSSYLSVYLDEPCLASDLIAEASYTPQRDNRLRISRKHNIYIPSSDIINFDTLTEAREYFYDIHNREEGICIFKINGETKVILKNRNSGTILQGYLSGLAEYLGELGLPNISDNPMREELSEGILDYLDNKYGVIYLE